MCPLLAPSLFYDALELVVRNCGHSLHAGGYYGDIWLYYSGK